MMTRENFALIAETFFDNTEIVEFCQKEIAKIDKRAEAKETASAENEALMAEMLTWLEAEGPKASASEIAEGVGVSTQKASYLLRVLFADGKVTREDEGRRYVYTVA